MATDFDAKILENLRDAEFEVEKISGCEYFIRFAHLTGRVVLSEASIFYGPSAGETKEWRLSGPNGSDASGALKWAVDETKKEILKIAARVEEDLKATQPIRL